MGYTHYWYREKEIHPEVYGVMVQDFKKLLPIFARGGVPLAGGGGAGEPQIDYNTICFNGLQKCGHPVNHELSIPWPSAKGHGVGPVAISGDWAAGSLVDHRCCNGDCSYETFYFPRVYGKDQKPIGDGPIADKYFEFCKTAFRPYDWAITAFLVIAKHYLRESIVVRSDGEMVHWQDAMMLCELELGYGMDFQLPDAGGGTRE